MCTHADSNRGRHPSQASSLASACVHTGMCTPTRQQIDHEPKTKGQKTEFPRMYTLRREKKKHESESNIYADTWTHIHIQEQNNNKTLKD